MSTVVFRCVQCGKTNAQQTENTGRIMKGIVRILYCQFCGAANRVTIGT